MPAIKVGVREFREKIAGYLESETPVAITRHGETVGVFVPTPRRPKKEADLSELRAAAQRLSQSLADIDEEEFAADFERLRKERKRSSR